MRILRPVVVAIFLVAAFFYFTTYRNLHPASWMNARPKVEVTEAAGGESLDSEEQNNINVYHKNIGSVVNITSRAMTFDFFYGLVPQEGQGSGFIIDKDGHILTNYHVIADARTVEVTLHNRKKYKATIVGTDRSHDLAVVQIKATDLQPMVLGDSTNLQVGQKVYAIGNPFGLSGTLTRGIVSSIRQVQEPDGMVIEEAIQTDAAINPGNSGGPLLNWHGEVIGINTMIASNVGQSAGIGFAIPIDVVNRVVPQLIRNGRVPTPGIGIVAVSEQAATRLGVEGIPILRTIASSPAQRAGLRGVDTRTGTLGDIIVSANNKPVQRLSDLTGELDDTGIGHDVKLGIVRDSRQQTISVAVVDVGQSQLGE